MSAPYYTIIRAMLTILVGKTLPDCCPVPEGGGHALCIHPEGIQDHALMERVKITQRHEAEA